MAVTNGNAVEFLTVRNPFNLQTQQKRLRHLRSLSVRNVHSGGQGGQHISGQQCYFTLHADPDAHAFYESEKITGSTNPSWQSFDISRFEEQIDLTSKFFVVRVWVGEGENFRLLILMEVHLPGLHLLADKLQELLVKHNPNTVIFHLLDREFIFINRDQTRVKNLVKKVSDLDLPTTLLPAVVKVEKGTVRNSYTTSSLSRIQTVLRAIKQMQAHSRRYRRQIEDRLLASQENSHKLEERECVDMRVGQLKRDLLRRSTLLQAARERLHAARELTAAKAETLRLDTEAAEALKQGQQEGKREYIMKREQLVKETALLNLRRRQMLTELLNYIYPITVDGGRYFINGTRLPHAEEFQGQDEAMIAVSLGYSCHLAVKMSQIMGLPLRHPMENRGSKSVIFDQVHSKLADKDREFPLYSKGKDKYHFNYGVFLLNKNISQLRFQVNVATLDLRQSLKNLMTLMHKLGVRMEGDSSSLGSLTPEGTTTALSAMSLNGSSASPSLAASLSLSQSLSLPPPSLNGDASRAQGSRPGQPHSKVSDLSEDGVSVADKAPTTKEEDGEEEESGGRKGEEGFDESEDIFKPASGDHFFKVSNSFTDGFNSMGVGDDNNGGKTTAEVTAEGAAAAASAASDHHHDLELTSRVSAILQTAAEGETLPKSFQLVKQKKQASLDTSGEDGSHGGADTDITGDSGSPDGSPEEGHSDKEDGSSPEKDSSDRTGVSGSLEEDHSDREDLEAKDNGDAEENGACAVETKDSENKSACDVKTNGNGDSDNVEKAAGDVEGKDLEGKDHCGVETMDNNGARDKKVVCGVGTKEKEEKSSGDVEANDEVEKDSQDVETKGIGDSVEKACVGTETSGGEDKDCCGVEAQDSGAISTEDGVHTMGRDMNGVEAQDSCGVEANGNGGSGGGGVSGVGVSVCGGSGDGDSAEENRESVTRTSSDGGNRLNGFEVNSVPETVSGGGRKTERDSGGESTPTAPPSGANAAATHWQEHTPRSSGQASPLTRSSADDLDTRSAPLTDVAWILLNECGQV